jgi:hypothetical protein
MICVSCNTVHANGDTRSGLRLRLCIAARDRRASQHPASDHTLNREEPVKRPGRLLVARVKIDVDAVDA